MKVAILSSASAGGAGIAAYRIYEALSESSEIEVDFFDISILGQVDTCVSPTHSASNNRITNTHFTVDYATEPRQWLVDFLADYDVLNIHWASYLLSLCEILELAKRGRRILFTLHDFHYITGGCHYPAGCLGYLEGCVGCPQVDERKYDQLSVINALKLKREIFTYENVHLAAPSAFIVNSAVHSGIIPDHRGHVLRNAYRPIEEFAPREWGNRRSILLIADSFDEQRKGLQLAVDSLKLALADDLVKPYDVELHLVGGMDQEVISQLSDLAVRIISHGHIKQHEKLVKIFKQCQFILTCSYEDNWPNILVESASYGCIPIVGRWHGCEEFVEKCAVGFKAENYMPIAFSQVIISALNTNYIFDLAVLKPKVDFIRLVHSYKNISKDYSDIFLFVLKYDDQFSEKKEIAQSNLLLSQSYILYGFLSAPEYKKNDAKSVKLKSLKTPFGCQTSTLDISCNDLEKRKDKVKDLLMNRVGYGLRQFEVLYSK